MLAGQAGLLGHDVLHKLDDQLLINRAQLAVLVRTYKPDYEIKITVIRKGLSRTIQATLAVTMLPVLGPGGKRSSTSWEEDYLKIRPRFPRGHKDAHSKIFNEENNRRVDNFLHDSSRKLAHSVAMPRKHSTTSNPSFARSGTRPHQQCERSAANYSSSRTDLTPEFDDDEISLTWKDDERFIHLGRSAHGVWLITVTDVDGHVTKKSSITILMFCRRMCV